MIKYLFDHRNTFKFYKTSLVVKCLIIKFEKIQDIFITMIAKATLFIAKEFPIKCFVYKHLEHFITTRELYRLQY